MHDAFGTRRAPRSVWKGRTAVQVIFNDWTSLAVVVAGVLFLIFVFSGKSAEILQFLLDAIRAYRQ